MRVPPFQIATIFILIAFSPGTQLQGRLYPFVELTDEMRAQIDLKDGSVEDWQEVLGEPTLTALDFETAPWSAEYEPSSFDFRIWLAWHRGDNHLFVAAQLFDDFVNERNYDRGATTAGQGLAGSDLSVDFGVDGDSSGGNLQIHNESGLEYPMQQAQWYGAFPGTYNNDNNLIIRIVSRHTHWVHSPPFADGGGATIGSQPGLGVVEFFVTPFDRLIWDNQEQSVVSLLLPGKIIGFFLQLVDVDENKNEFASLHGLYGPDRDAGYWSMNESDFWARGILLSGAQSPERDSAVNRVSWARIKATLSE